MIFCDWKDKLKFEVLDAEDASFKAVFTNITMNRNHIAPALSDH